MEKAWKIGKRKGGRGRIWEEVKPKAGKWEVGKGKMGKGFSYGPGNQRRTDPKEEAEWRRSAANRVAHPTLSHTVAGWARARRARFDQLMSWRDAYAGDPVDPAANAAKVARLEQAAEKLFALGKRQQLRANDLVLAHSYKPAVCGTGCAAQCAS